MLIWWSTPCLQFLTPVKMFSLQTQSQITKSQMTTKKFSETFFHRMCRPPLLRKVVFTYTSHQEFSTKKPCSVGKSCWHKNQTQYAKPFLSLDIKSLEDEAEKVKATFRTWKLWLIPLIYIMLLSVRTCWSPLHFCFHHYVTTMPVEGVSRPPLRLTVLRQPAVRHSL